MGPAAGEARARADGRPPSGRGASSTERVPGASASELGLDGEPTVEYRPRSRADDGRAARRRARRAAWASDLERGFTGHGPHRDDLALARDGRELRAYGSQGQQRLGLLALLLAEREAIGRRRNATPLMLLDDVMSELDGDRRRELVALLAGRDRSSGHHDDRPRSRTRVRSASRDALGGARRANCSRTWSPPHDVVSTWSTHRSTWRSTHARLTMGPRRRSWQRCRAPGRRWSERRSPKQATPVRVERRSPHGVLRGVGLGPGARPHGPGDHRPSSGPSAPRSGDQTPLCDGARVGLGVSAAPGPRAGLGFSADLQVNLPAV